jgi:hypothetical protein
VVDLGSEWWVYGRVFRKGRRPVAVTFLERGKIRGFRMVGGVISHRATEQQRLGFVKVPGGAAEFF